MNFITRGRSQGYFFNFLSLNSHLYIFISRADFPEYTLHTMIPLIPFHPLLVAPLRPRLQEQDVMWWAALTDAPPDVLEFVDFGADPTLGTQTLGTKTFVSVRRRGLLPPEPPPAIRGGASALPRTPP